MPLTWKVSDWLLVTSIVFCWTTVEAPFGPVMVHEIVLSVSPPGRVSWRPIEPRSPAVAWGDESSTGATGVAAPDEHPNWWVASMTVMAAHPPSERVVARKSGLRTSDISDSVVA